MRIETPEVIAALESANLGRLTTAWTVVAFERGGGDVLAAKTFSEELGCMRGYDAVMAHVATLPDGQRGFVHESAD